MKRFFLAFLFLMLIALALPAQQKDVNYRFYGFVRGDLFYNTRASVAAVGGNFYLYPMDEKPDANGEDLNATPNGSFYTFTTRVGMDVTGPMLGSAKTSAKIETDFGGFSSSATMLRIRQAYVALDWEGKSQLLLGQTWHPMFGSVVPDILNLSTGAPFQPFNRSPMIRFRHKSGRMEWLGAAVWQLQYTSDGPNGVSEEYIKNSCVPEFFAGLDYVGNGWLIGAGARLISLKPRTFNTWNDYIYKVNERMTTLTYEAHFKYTGINLTIAAKSMIASAMENTAMLGGYGVRSVNPQTGEQQYTPFRHSVSWLNLTYGKKWKPGLFFGYAGNLGTDHQLVSADKLYGRALNIDKLISIAPSLSYNLPHWRVGMEYSFTKAHYGTIDLNSGKVKNSHPVSNHRLLGVFIYTF